MEERAIRGVPWTLVTFAGSKLLALATVVVLARLLVPADFGLIALATLAVAFITYFGTFGLQAALILRQDLSDQEQGTLLTLMLVAGSATAVLLAASSPLVADLFREPRLGEIVAALSVLVALGSPRAFYEALLQREFQFRRRFVAQIGYSIVNAFVAITLAALGAGVWSLVAGQVAGTVVHVVMLMALAPYRVRPRFVRSQVRMVLSSGWGFFVQGFAFFLQENVDYFAIGRVLGSAQVGFYSMAYRLGELPYYGIAEPVAKVTFPAFAQMRHHGENVTSAFLSTLRLVALITVPLGVLLSASAEPFVRAILGEKWLPMITVLSVLGVWAAVRPTQATVSWLLNSIGSASLLGLLAGIALLALVPAVLVAVQEGGVEAVAWVVVAEAAVSALVFAFFASRRADIGIRLQWRALRPIVIAAPVTWLAARLVAEATADEIAALSLMASVAAGVAGYVGVVALSEPGLLRTAAAQIGRTIGRAPVDPARAR